jgi:SAM-dependent methyltransferase
LRKHLRLNGPLFFVHESTPTNSPADILERGGLRKHGRFLPLNNYQPLPMDILDESLDLVTCYIGLHHSPPERLQSFIRSIVRVLRPGGLFILRDHDVKNLPMGALVSLAHAVFNAGLGISWEENQKELRLFAPLAEWSRRLEAEGLKDKGERLFQANDPTDNALMIFSKPSGPVDLNGGV